MEFVVYGKVSKVTPRSIVVLSWAFAHEADAAANENQENVKSFTIVRRAIVKVTKLIPYLPHEQR